MPKSSRLDKIRFDFASTMEVIFMCEFICIFVCVYNYSPPKVPQHSDKMRVLMFITITSV